MELITLNLYLESWELIGYVSDWRIPCLATRSSSSKVLWPRQDTCYKGRTCTCSTRISWTPENGRQAKQSIFIHLFTYSIIHTQYTKVSNINCLKLRGCHQKWINIKTKYFFFSFFFWGKRKSFIFFRAVLGSQQNWAESTESCPGRTNAQSPPLSTSSTRVVRALQLIKLHWHVIVTQSP